MEEYSICNLFPEKSCKSEQYKSVKHHEKLGQYYCKQCNSYMILSDKDSHLNSDEQKKNKNIKIWCEYYSKYISDTTRHFQTDIHLRNKQNNLLNQQNTFSLDTRSAFGTQQSSVQGASGTQQSSP